MAIKIQDAYALGMAIHGRIVQKGIWKAHSPEAFKVIWEEAIAHFKGLVDKGEFGLRGDVSDIDWTFYDEPALPEKPK